MHHFMPSVADLYPYLELSVYILRVALLMHHQGLEGTWRKWWYSDNGCDILAIGRTMAHLPIDFSLASGYDAHSIIDMRS